ncbi:MAG: leucine-rich repeat domain-containing protein [Spirochaetaceae bacterium]|jgi:hypothetical protein|nr:leucine-rich repeat domain-containing protein [Spirochaetaceae bacterium]
MTPVGLTKKVKKLRFSLAVLLSASAAIFSGCQDPSDDGGSSGGTPSLPSAGISWGAVQVDGESGVKDSASILFTFSADPGALSEEYITLKSAEGSSGGAVIGELTGEGKIRRLALTLVKGEGPVEVSIQREGIAPGPKTITLYRQARADGAITYLVSPSGHDTAGVLENSSTEGGKSTNQFIFTFSSPVDNLQANEINMQINGWHTLSLTPNGDKTVWTLEGEIIRDIAVNRWVNLQAVINHADVNPANINPEPPKYYLSACMGWTANIAGNPQTITINFPFNLSKPLLESEVTLEMATIVDSTGVHTGLARTGAITGAGRIWTITLAEVESTGPIAVIIRKAGVFSKGAVENAGGVYPNRVNVTATMAPNDFTVVQIGGTSGTVSSTAIQLTFNRAVENLVAQDIAITSNGGNGSVRGTLTSSTDKKVWTVPVSVAVEGSITVKIPSKPGVTAAEKTVTVFKNPSVKTSETGEPYLDAYLSTLGITSPASPATVHLHNSVNIAGDWGLVNSAVTAAAKYVMLDLSACLDAGIIGAATPSGNAFNIIHNNPYIKGIILPAGLTEIGDYAFQECNNITQVGNTANTLRIPASVTRIGVKAFYDVTSINNLVFETRSGSSTLNIGAYAFAKGSGAEPASSFSGSLILPGNVTFEKSGGGQASYTFQYRSLFTTLVIGSGCSEIPEQAFSYCSGLQEVTIPASISSILAYAFRYDYAVTRFTCGRGYDNNTLKAQGSSSESTLNMYKLRPSASNTGLAAAGTYIWNDGASTWDLQ